MRDDTIDLQEVRSLPPAELADQLERWSATDTQEILPQLSGEEVAAVLAELDAEQASRLLPSFTDEQVTTWLRLLPPHVTADLVATLPTERQEHLLAGLPVAQSAAVAALLRYPPDSAGGIMDSRFIAVRADQTVDQCLAHLRASQAQHADQISYIYVVDDAHRLVGVVSLRSLVFGPREQRLVEIMNREVRFLRASDDQEKVAQEMQHHSFLGLPVVDEQERLVGVVKLRDAIRVAQTEATEDMQLMVGLSGEERIWTPWKQSVARRLPWLGVNLVTALGAATVVSFFEGTLARWTALVVFLPLISAVAGNTGNQALTVIIRALALGEVSAGDAIRVLRKELAIGLANGFMLGLAIGLLAFGWKGSVLLGAVAGVAMMLNQVVGALSGVAIPFGLRHCGIDPALASSIFVTTITDIIGFIVFLSLAATAMRLFGL